MSSRDQRADQTLVVTADVRQNANVPTYPDAAVLYPEVAAMGSLAAALQAVADRQGLSVPVEVVEHSPLFGAVVPTTVPHRQALEVSASRVERRWSVRGCEPDQDMALIEGATTDYDQIVKAAQAWRDGERLSRIAELAPFVELTGRFEVFGRDPAQMVESEWQHLLVEAASTDWPEYRALIDAAYNQPRLRRLYPFTSHWSLQFSTRTRPHLSREILVCINPGKGKDYVVTMGLTGDELGAKPSRPRTPSPWRYNTFLPTSTQRRTAQFETAYSEFAGRSDGRDSRTQLGLIGRPHLGR